MTQGGDGSDRPWYADGIRWQCTVCGQCCRDHGDGYRYIFSTRKERVAIAASLEMKTDAFEEEFCERAGGGVSFRSKGDACVFLTSGNLCRIYQLRPAQCRTFPFWPELLADRDAWEREIGSFCPGIGTGPLLSRATIEQRMKEARS